MIDVSHIIVVYNKSPFLPSVIAALMGQGGNFSREFIFVDDRSTDNTVQVIKSCVGDASNVSLVEGRSNKGPSLRFNEGVAIAKGEFVHLIDGDDIVPVGSVAGMLDHARAADADAVFGKWQQFDQPIEELVGRPYDASAPVQVIDTPLDFVLKGGWARMGKLIRRDLYNAAAGCDTTVFVQDESLSLRVAARSKRLVAMAAPAIFVSDRTGALSRNKTQQHYDRYLAFRNLDRDCPNLTAKQRWRVRLSAISSVWKNLRKDPGSPYLLPILALYLASKILHTTPPDWGFRLAERHFRRHAANIRTVDKAPS